MTTSEPGDTRKATQYLIDAEIDQLSTAHLYRQIKAGFFLLDVQTMLSEMAPHHAGPILRRILGVSRIAKLRSSHQSIRLTAQQSAVAFMYATMFELASTVFGSRHRAEIWLSQPFRDLDGDVPLDVLDNQCAYRILEKYLQRIELGIYQ